MKTVKKMFRPLLKNKFLIAFFIFLFFTSVHVAGADGNLIINTDPAGANIYLDGSLLNAKTNEGSIFVPKGYHEIKLTLPGYYDYEETVSVKGTTYVDHFFRERSSGSIISSKPSGAKIILDDEFIGYTDKQIELNEGYYKINLTLDGYLPYEETLYLDPKGGVGIHHDFEPIPTDGTVYINSIPSQAEIFLDGENIGRTNKIIYEVAPGSHTINLQKTGYEEAEINFDVSVLAPTKLTMELKPLDGYISVSSTPVEGGEVYIDNQLVGTAPFIEKFSKGTHSVKIVTYGFKDYEEKVDLDYLGVNVIGELISLAPEAIESAEISINNNQKYNPTQAIQLLEDAKTLLQNEDYQNAYEKAQEAKKIAEDVDQDLIPNGFDIQPHVYNNILYMILPFIFLIVIIIFVIDWKRCNLDPKVSISVQKTDSDEDTNVDVTLNIDKNYSSVVCSIYLDGQLIENLTELGKNKINLGKLSKGEHELEAKLSVKKTRYGVKSVNEVIKVSID